MRSKLNINSDISNGWAAPKSTNLKRYFGKLIDFLLAENPVLYGDTNGQQVTYCKNDLAENALKQICVYSQSGFWQLVGYTGTGKTSAIRGTFGLWGHNSANELKENCLLVSVRSTHVDCHSLLNYAGVAGEFDAGACQL